MTSTNPTAEQIVEEALNRIDLYADEMPKAVVCALRAHNLLSEGAPSEEQIERAARAICRTEQIDALDVYDRHSEAGREAHRKAARAALTAAGATPQEPGNDQLFYQERLSDGSWSDLRPGPHPPIATGREYVFRTVVATSMQESSECAEWQKARETFISYKVIADEAWAERDAALAAIERCREVAMQHRSVEQHNEMVPLSDIADLIREPSSAEYLAALDGAPEPEWEYGAKVYNSGRVVRIEDSPEKVRLGRSAISYANPQWVDDVLVRRRKAGPWLPVEGDKP